ncbi:MAG: response regulator transcription factor [Clostridia bacterium]|nr:response regulator transcription factor [Clostridia bacterium]
MKEKPIILLVDDDPSILQLVELYLVKEGFDVRTAQRGDDALAEFRRNQPDLILLDLMLPGVDGTGVLKTIRRTSSVPVIILTARDETIDKVLQLELGADDYITKPFDMKELVARVKAVLRRTSGPESEKDDTLSFPGLSISLSQYEVHYEGKRVDMPPKELELLYYLASHAGQVFTREQLLEHVWGFGFAGDSSRTVDVHVKRVREKLPGREAHGWDIATVWGVGYKFEVKA